MNDSANAVRLPSDDDVIAPVTILDGQGHVVQVLAADEFRRAHPREAGRAPLTALRPRRRASAAA